MKKDVMVEYLNSGLMARKNYKTFTLGSGLVVIWGILPGIYLNSYWLNIGIVML